MKTIHTIADYCRHIDIPPPLHDHFDIRRFEDNMRSVKANVQPFRHEFYAVALRHFGTNQQVMGVPLEGNLFFNTPYQIVTWDIDLDWRGWYIMFDNDFVSSSATWSDFLIDFPFFRLDKVAPFDLPTREIAEVDQLFQRIFREYHQPAPDKFVLIQALTHLLLLIVKRYFNQSTPRPGIEMDKRTADTLLLSRFQSLLETMIHRPDTGPEIRQIKSYAERLHVHPNHLNAVVKRLTGKTATQLLHQTLIRSAASLLRQTNLSVKEIAFRLHFPEPTHFNRFFKRKQGLSPQQYREAQNL